MMALTPRCETACVPATASSDFYRINTVVDRASRSDALEHQRQSDAIDDIMLMRDDVNLYFGQRTCPMIELGQWALSGGTRGPHGDISSYLKSTFGWADCGKARAAQAISCSKGL